MKCLTGAENFFQKLRRDRPARRLTKRRAERFVRTRRNAVGHENVGAVLCILQDARLRRKKYLHTLKHI